MARTTLDLDPGLIRELKYLAARGRESMSRTANRLLRDALERHQRELHGARPLPWHVAEGASPAEGFDPADRSYLDFLDESD
ncbi:MAG TPA: hypothetical protein VFM44_03060 [Gemmatimonadota bacterium]|nr:hypothetical protein [Gemmatimonadota bacterium]